MKTFSHPFDAIAEAAKGEEVVLTGDHPPLLVRPAPKPGEFVVTVNREQAELIQGGVYRGSGTLRGLADQLPDCLYCGDTGRCLAVQVKGKRCTCPAGEG